MAAWSERREPFICAECGKTFFNAWAHMEECTGKTVRTVNLREEHPDAHAAWVKSMRREP